MINTAFFIRIFLNLVNYIRLSLLMNDFYAFNFYILFIGPLQCQWDLLLMCNVTTSKKNDINEQKYKTH